MASTTTFPGTRDELLAHLRRLPAVLAGREPDTHGLARRARRAVADELQALARAAFRQKAAGGTGSDGVRWAPLSAATRRRRPTRRGLLFVTGALLDGLRARVRADGRVELYAASKPWHHAGVRGRLPARPLWPEEVPPAWWARLRGALAGELSRALAELLRGGVRP